MDPKLERKRLFVDRHVQGGIVARLLLVWAASTGLACMVWFGLQFFANPAGDLVTHVAVAGRLATPLILSFLVILPIAVLYLLRFTHRFAGPILRLRRSMRELAAGQTVPRLRFRDGDYWQDLADEFNNVSETLKAARSRIGQLEAKLNTKYDSPTQNSQSLTDSEAVASVAAGK